MISQCKDGNVYKGTASTFKGSPASKLPAGLTERVLHQSPTPLPASPCFPQWVLFPRALLLKPLTSKLHLRICFPGNQPKIFPIKNTTQGNEVADEVIQQKVRQLGIMCLLKEVYTTIYEVFLQKKFNVN